MREILSGAGFANIDIASHRRALAFEADIAGTVTKLVQLGPMAQPIAEAPADVQQRIGQDLAAAIEPCLTDDGVRIDSASWIVSADKP